MSETAVIFDLEYTAWDGSRARGWSDPDEHREIVQIGAVRLDVETAEEQAAFLAFVRPALHPQLSAYFTDLTGITQAQLDNQGQPFAEAYAQFIAFCGQDRLYCYGWDHEVIAENLLLTGTLCQFGPATPAGNLHYWFQPRGIDIARINSGRLATHLGIPVTGAGQEHDALFDCRSQAAAIRYHMAQGTASPLTTPLPTGPIEDKTPGNGHG